jgi:hypothetical protein
VLTESGIEFLSHALLFPDKLTRYASIGGELSANQPMLISAAILKMPVGGQIVGAFNADANGRSYAEIVRRIVAASARSDLVFAIHEPFGFKDWNDQVRGIPASPPLSFPTARLDV